MEKKHQLLFPLTFIQPFTAAVYQHHSGLMSLLHNCVGSKTGYYTEKGMHTTKIGTLQCICFKKDSIVHFSDLEVTAGGSNRDSPLLVIMILFAISV